MEIVVLAVMPAISQTAVIQAISVDQKHILAVSVGLILAEYHTATVRVRLLEVVIILEVYAEEIMMARVTSKTAIMTVPFIPEIRSAISMHMVILPENTKM